MKKILILLAEPRTGTSLINHGIRTYRPLMDLQEFFHSNNTVSDLIELYDKNETSIFLKTLSNQLDIDSIKQLVCLPFVEVIYLTRDNKLATYVSWQKALRHDLWHDHDTSNFKITLCVDQYQQWLANSTAWHNEIQLSLTTKHVLMLNYEQHIENFQYAQFLEITDNWFKQIGLEFYKLPLTKNFTFRQNTLSVEHSIENWNDIVDKINH
jgi:hypothetical protein